MTTASRLLLLLAAALPSLGFNACSSGPPQPPAGRYSGFSESDAFGTTADGQAVERYVLRNDAGIEAHLITYGATLTKLYVPDRTGKRADIVLGFDDVAGYESDRNQYFGATVGRVANRIAQGRFGLGGQTYQLATNNDVNHLHGGPKGYHTKVWEARTLELRDGPAVEFHLISPDGDEKYPGELEVWVTYRLTHDNELRIDYRATSDAPTPVNLTHHSYFNLAGAGAPTVLDHVLKVNASRYTAGDETLIPTGELASVEGTPFDFRTPTRIGARLAEVQDGPELGYDLNYVLDREGAGLERAAILSEPNSGRVMEVWTTEPGLQFYSGNFLNGQSGKEAKAYPHRGACCLETQHFPDSPNQPAFPSVTLWPGETYTHTVVHRFGTDR